MKTAAAYIRVSTEDQIEYSPDSQLKKIREYAASQNIFLPEEYIFVDEGISGRHAEKRPAFMQMIGLAKMKPKSFDCILLWKFSRFARNREDAILYKSMLRKECGIDVISITEQLSSDPTAILIEALLEAMDEYYSINLAQEVKRGMNEKFSRGGVVSVPPFGYTMGEEHFEVDEVNAAVVQMVYEDFLNGMGYRQIAQKLNDMGIKTTRGNNWENRTIEYVLSNPVYIGKLRRNPNGTDRTDRFHQGEAVLLVDGKHTPVISEETFTAVQERRENIKISHPKHTRTSYTDYMLRGLVRCSSCGSTLVQAVKGESLQCHRYAKGQCTVSHCITIKKIDQAVLAALEQDLTFDGSLQIAVRTKTSVIPSDAIGLQLKREQQKLERIKASYEAGIDTLEEYKQRKTEIQQIIEGLKAQMQEPKELTGEEIRRQFRQRLSCALPKLRSPQVSENDKNELLRTFISDIIFDRKNGSIQMFYYL